ncbi:LysR family transcriptional regulator [uncultured Roseovarius sp.]|uniref:LysR family transcriptional regulator n=1 Tax=uncultured Roseovarius sp. TaxID=293344 RepID=UPI00263842DD|nr:LysR family transcriptional regulator [uncultured Roseovarius sp.]
MVNVDALQAFVLSAELGSFSAAARRMGKVQSAVSMTIANLEIDCGVELFDRSRRNPVLTAEGQTLLPHAKGILLGNREFLATANSMAEGIETHVCLSVEQGISLKPLAGILNEFGNAYPQVSLEITTPAPGVSAEQLRLGVTDIGLMAEQEGYPAGFQFRGLAYSKIVPICAPDHPLSDCDQASYRDLRQHRQIVRYKTPIAGTPQRYEKKSAVIWHVEDPNLILDLVKAGFGWAEIPQTIAAKPIESGELISLQYAFQQNDLLEGIDLVWTEQRSLGAAGHWMRDEILKLPQAIWQNEWA